MSRLSRIFGKRRGGENESGSDADDGLMSDTADLEVSSQDTTEDFSRSVPDWGDWSIGEDMSSRHDEDDNVQARLVPLKKEKDNQMALVKD